MRKLLTILFPVLLLAACGKPAPEEQKAAAPKFVSVTPADGAVDVKVTDKLEITIKYDVNAKIDAADRSKATISPALEQTGYDAHDKMIVLTFSKPAYQTKYTFSLPAGIVVAQSGASDAAGAVTTSFTTEEEPYVAPEPGEVVPEDNGNLAWSMAKKLAMGWNMGNQMDAYSNDKSSETAWGQPKCTQQTFNKLKSYGYSSVRIPITWMGHIGEAPDYKIEEAWMNRVAEIVEYAEKAGLYCIINTHHDENHKNHGAYDSAHWQDILKASQSAETNTAIKNELKAIWTQIAEKFKDKGDFLIFEPFNEINDGGWGYSNSFVSNPSKQTDILNEWNQVFVDAVRATGGNNSQRWLCVAGYAAASSFVYKYTKLPTDSAQNKLMVGFHCYDPYEFCTQATKNEWGHTANPSQSAGNEKAITDMMANYYANYVAKGIPCYIGEFGCVNRDDSRPQAFQKYYLEYFCRAARTYGLPAFIWDNGNIQKSGERFAYVDHGTGAYLEQGSVLVPMMIKAWTSNDKSYTLESIYNNSAPKN